MPSSPLRPRNVLATIAAMVALAGCQTGPAPTHPVPSVQQIGSDLKCKTGDHGFEDQQAGWGFCYPGTWHYNERSQGSQNPPGLDLTFDITDIPCTTPSPGSQNRPVCSPDAGRFAYMIIGTYERGVASDLAAWEKTYMPSASTAQTIKWGNAVEAAKLADGRRVALTQHHVVVLDMRSANALLDLEGQMSSRLDTWTFTY